ncbi:uncharacterized protein LOC105220002 [Zeugodacus cucurbitae]|uniref:Uncharacterized protein n=1 Tax=Zeugodacus cucurbitae TaxID=28588 RepID=A0A0A1X974_ZEUCU|nr:uncharacterized protein LOC105220002 [Zeugodacus cucurbitae]
MQFLTLLATLLLITTTHNSDGYGLQQTSLQQNNGPYPIYGPPPLSPPAAAPCTEQTAAPAATQVPVLTAVVRTLGPSGRNYEVKLSQSNHLNLVHAQPPQHAAINGPPSYYTNNYQPGSTSARYLPPTIPTQLRPYPQAFRGIPEQQYGNSAAGSHISYSSHQNPLLTPQYIQRTPHTALTPPPSQSQSFSHFSNQQQQHLVVGSQLGNQQQQQSIPGSQLSNQQQQQPFAGSPLGAQQGNNVDINGIAPNSQFSAAAQTNSPSTSSTDGSINGIPGNYISQSEVGQLDHYFEKQNPVGDTRPFTRVISTCYPDGHCEQQQLGAGQVDQRHQHVVTTARARVQPISDKCRALSNTGAIAPFSVGSVSVGGAALNSMKRPPNRRRYPYTEVVIPRDPFN